MDSNVQKINRLTTDVKLSRRIAEHLLSSSNQDYTRVSTAAQQGRVVLSSVVRTESARTDALRFVAQVSGVSNILNNLIVEADVTSGKQRGHRAWIARGAVAAAILILAVTQLPSALALLPSESNAPPLSTYPVTLHLTCDGYPADGAQVVLFPTVQPVLDDETAFVPRPMGTADRLGRVQFKTFQHNDGVPAGRYRATVQWHKTIRDGEDVVDGPNLVSLKYANPGVTPLWVNVKPGVNPPVVIQLDPNS